MQFLKLISRFTLCATFMGLLTVANTATAASTKNASELFTPSLPKTILVIDLSADNKATYNGFLQGKNGVLIYQEDAKPSQKDPARIIQSEAFLTKVFNQYQTLNKKTLTPFDKNHDGVIDVNDPIYKQLRVMYIDKNKQKDSQLIIENLDKAGIQKIVLDGHYTSLPADQRNSGTEYIAGKAYMADGSEKTIHDISL